MAAHAAAVYVGTVAEQVGRTDDQQDVRFRIRVDRSLKIAVVGSDRVVVTSASGGGCGAALQVGRRAFVAEDPSGRVSECCATHDDVDGEIARYVRYNRALPETGTTPSVGAVSAVLLLAGLLGRRRLARRPVVPA